MSPQGSNSEPKRRRSPIVRDPSPKRNRRDGKAESEVPPEDLEMEMLRSAQASKRQGKAPLAPKHTNCDGVGPYRRSCAVASGEWRSDPNERLKHTRSKNHLIEKKIPAVDVQKANNVYPPRRRIRTLRRIEFHSLGGPIVKNDDSGDDASGDDSSGDDDAGDVSDGDGDDIRTKAKKLLLNSIMGYSKRNRRDGKAESEVPPANLEMLILRSAQASKRQGKAPLAPKHTNSGSVSPYRRSCAVASGERRSDPIERLKHTRSKNHLIEKKIPPVDVQKANKATTVVYPRRMRMPWICRGHTNRPVVKDDASGDDESGISDGDGDGDGDDIHTKAK